MATWHDGPSTAQDRLDASFWSHAWAGILLVAFVHFALLRLVEFHGTPGAYTKAPTMESVAIEDPPSFEIPPPPAPIGRPAIPVVPGGLLAPPELTVAPPGLRDLPVVRPPMPPAEIASNDPVAPAFVPRDVRPALLNRVEVERALFASYPATFNDAGIRGTTTLWISLDDTGRILQTRVVASSGFRSLDAIAQRVMQRAARFSPAYRRNLRVAIEIVVPVTFRPGSVG